MQKRNRYAQAQSHPHFSLLTLYHPSIFKPCLTFSIRVPKCLIHTEVRNE